LFTFCGIILGFSKIKLRYPCIRLYYSNIFSANQ